MFEAVVGLDPEHGLKGRVRLRVLVDGKERDLGWNKELTAGDGPLTAWRKSTLRSTLPRSGRRALAAYVSQLSSLVQLSTENPSPPLRAPQTRALR